MDYKEKAKELIDIFGKELAVKCVDEILNTRPYELKKIFSEIMCINILIDKDEYWEEVKNEILNYETT